MIHGKMDRCRESQGCTTAISSVCPNVVGRTKDGIAQSKRVQADSFAIVN